MTWKETETWKEKGKRGSHVNLARLGLSSDQSLPGFVALVNDLGSVLAVLGFSGEGELERERIRKRLASSAKKREEGTEGTTYLVLGLSVRDFVDAAVGKEWTGKMCQSWTKNETGESCESLPEPFVRSTDETGEVTFDVLDVVELGREGVVDVNDENLPVGLSLVEESHDSEDLDLLDLSGVTDGLTNLANVERVVISEGLGLGVSVGRVLPRLGERSVVPDVTLVGETVANETEFALLRVLEDRVELLFLRDFEFRVGPTGDLDNHVEDGTLLVREEGNVVEGRDDFAILLDVRAVLCSFEGGEGDRESWVSTSDLGERSRERDGGLFQRGTHRGCFERRVDLDEEESELVQEGLDEVSTRESERESEVDSRTEYWEAMLALVDKCLDCWDKRLAAELASLIKTSEEVESKPRNPSSRPSLRARFRTPPLPFARATRLVSTSLTTLVVLRRSHLCRLLPRRLDHRPNGNDWPHHILVAGTRASLYPRTAPLPPLSLDQPWRRQSRNQTST